MKGYFSFILVFLLSLLLISSIELYQSKQSFSLSKAIISERTYEIGSNTEHSISESLLQGAIAGFGYYDSTHFISMCNHCLDYYCDPTPATPNQCDEALCSFCFRDEEAKKSARLSALSSLASVREISSNYDFNVSFNDPQIEVFLKPVPISKNGVVFSHFRTIDHVLLSVASSKFNISAQKTITGLIRYG